MPTGECLGTSKEEQKPCRAQKGGWTENRRKHPISQLGHLPTEKSKNEYIISVPHSTLTSPPSSCTGTKVRDKAVCYLHSYVPKKELMCVPDPMVHATAALHFPGTGTSTRVCSLGASSHGILPSHHCHTELLPHPKLRGQVFMELLHLLPDSLFQSVSWGLS